MLLVASSSDTEEVNLREGSPCPLSSSDSALQLFGSSVSCPRAQRGLKEEKEGWVS